MAGNLIITINRQYGSGGKEVGTKLANLLGIKIYDSEIPKMASEKSGIRKDYFEKVDEKPTDSFLYALAMNTFSMTNAMNPLDNTLSSDRLFNIQAEVIRDLAKKNPLCLSGAAGNIFCGMSRMWQGFMSVRLWQRELSAYAAFII